MAMNNEARAGLIGGYLENWYSKKAQRNGRAKGVGI